MNYIFKNFTIIHKLLSIVLCLMCTNQLQGFWGTNKHWCDQYSFYNYWRRPNWVIYKYVSPEICKKSRFPNGLIMQRTPRNANYSLPKLQGDDIRNMSPEMSKNLSPQKQDQWNAARSALLGYYRRNN